MTDNAEWLAQITEEIIEPERPIIDPHHHLWDRNGSRYLLDELLEDTGSGHNIVATVFVECMSMYRADGPDALKPVGETEFVNGVAAMSASGGFGPTRACAGIVGDANLLLGDDVAPVLEAHLRAAPDRFRGIRHAGGCDASAEIKNSHTNPPEHLFINKTFQAGFKRLADYNMSFEAWCYHPQIPEVTALARDCPEVTIIFNHFGGPLGIGPYAGKRAEIFAQWQKDVAELATCPNVVAKLGGLVMPINGFDFHKQPKPPTSQELADTTRDWYLHMIDCFGPDRCMFESNFPVDKASCSYAVLWNSFKRIADGFSDDEKQALFHDTAARTYRLGEFL